MPEEPNNPQPSTITSAQTSENSVTIDATTFDLTTTDQTETTVATLVGVPVS